MKTDIEQMQILRDCFYQRPNWSTPQLAALGVEQSGRKVLRLKRQKGWDIQNKDPNNGIQYERNFTAITLGARVGKQGRPKGARNKATPSPGMSAGEMMGLMRRASL